MKVQAESFHLNGHIIGFRLQTQKLESPYKTPSSTLAVKGLGKLYYPGEPWAQPESCRKIPSVRSQLLASWFGGFVFFATLRDTGLHSTVAVASGARLSCFEFHSVHLVYCCLFHCNT